jgi:hypothetical protein
MDQTHFTLPGTHLSTSLPITAANHSNMSYFNLKSVLERNSTYYYIPFYKIYFLLVSNPVPHSKFSLQLAPYMNIIGNDLVL